MMKKLIRPATEAEMALWYRSIREVVVEVFATIAGRDQVCDVVEFVRWMNVGWQETAAAFRGPSATVQEQPEASPSPAVDPSVLGGDAILQAAVGTTWPPAAAGTAPNTRPPNNQPPGKSQNKSPDRSPNRSPRRVPRRSADPHTPERTANALKALGFERLPASAQELDQAVRDLLLNTSPQPQRQPSATKEAASVRTQSILKARQHLQRVVMIDK
jgi:hypothetical protein